MRLRLRHQLTLAIACALLPVIVLSVGLGWFGALRQRSDIERRMLETARSLSLGVDREVGIAVAGLDALATSSHIKEGDYGRFRDEAERFLRNRPGWLSIIDEDGQQLLNTHVSRRAPLPKTENAEWLRNAFSADPVFISGALTGPNLKTPYISISERIEQRPKNIVLTLSIGPETLSELLQLQHLPDRWIGIIADRSGTIIGRSQGAEFVGQKMAARPEAPAGVMSAQTLEGTPVVLAWLRSPQSGWLTGVAAPTDFVDAPVRQTLTAMLGAGGVALLLAVLGALLIARWIAQPIGRLADHVGHNGADLANLPVVRSTTREVDELSAAFREKAAELSRALAAREGAEQELRGLNQELERRVTERTLALSEANERLRAEIDERRAAEEKLVQVQKIEAMGQLTGGLSHDFNNLLAAIIGNLELASQSRNPQKTTRFIENALRAAGRGAKLNDQLLAFARKQRLEARAVELASLIASMQDMLTITMGGMIRLEIRLAAALWPVLTDVSQLELAILNLAINARDAMPQGGVLLIEAENVALRAPGPGSELGSGDYVRLMVSDSGTGMSPEVLAKAFDPFFTTKEPGKGSGLGLSQVYGFVRQSGGNVQVASQLGKGTHVALYLPRAFGIVDGPAAPREAQPGGDGTGRVLVVDDDPEVLEVIGETLETAGYETLLAASGPEALHALSEDHIAMMIADFAMPGMNGVELALEATALHPQLAVIIVSGYAEADATSAVAERFLMLRKPFSTVSLLSAVRAVLAGPDDKVVQLARGEQLTSRGGPR